MSSEKSKILVVGATGHLGRHVVAASARLGHPTFALVRDTAPPNPAKAALLQSFRDGGVTLLKGDLADYGSLVSAAKHADVVISTVGVRQIADQTRLIDAIKEAGNIKRFVPSEFGLDADRTAAVEPIRSLIIDSKAAVRRAVEASGVPYTYAWTGYFFSYGLPGIGQVLAQSPPADNNAVVVLGDGDSKVSYVVTSTRGTSAPTRCWPPATRAPRTRRSTSSRRPTRCRTMSSWTCGRRRPGRSSSGCISTRTPCSSRSERIRSRSKASCCQSGMRCTSRGNTSSRSTNRQVWTPASCTRT